MLVGNLGNETEVNDVVSLLAGLSKAKALSPPILAARASGEGWDGLVLPVDRTRTCTTNARGSEDGGETAQA